jgi:hypothetical protein
MKGVRIAFSQALVILLFLGGLMVQSSKVAAQQNQQKCTTTVECAQQAVDAAARADAAVKALEQKLQDIQKKLPSPADFYVKPIPPTTQYSEMNCGDDILISAACTNHLGAQTAVGPKFFDRDGKRWASCERYGGIVWEAEGQLICMKHH